MLTTSFTTLNVNLRILVNGSQLYFHKFLKDSGLLLWHFFCYSVHRMIQSKSSSYYLGTNLIKSYWYKHIVLAFVITWMFG